MGILGALVLSASATVLKAAEHGVAAGERPFAVAMLEVVAMAGTLLAIFGATSRTRRRGMVTVIATCTVTAVAGWSAYGWFGLVGAVGLVALVHLAAETWRESRPIDSPGDEDEYDGLENENENENENESDGPYVERMRGLVEVPEVPGIAPRVVAQAVELLTREPSAGRPRIRNYLAVTDHAAGKLLRALRPMKSVGEAS